MTIAYLQGIYRNKYVPPEPIACHLKVLHYVAMILSQASHSEMSLMIYDVKSDITRVYLVT